MFSISTSPPTIRASPMQRLNTATPTQQPSSIPTFLPSFRPTFGPTFGPSFLPTFGPTFGPTFNPSLFPTASSIGSSSINSASNGQAGVSSTAIGVGVGCIIILLIVVGACIFVSRNGSKEKMSPYQIWTSHYSGQNHQNKNKYENDNIINHPPVQVKEDIHHFYNKSSKPSFNQNTVFTPHVSGRISSRNSQILSPIGIQKNNRLSISPNNRNSILHAL
jgi:hypothetical protein